MPTTTVTDAISQRAAVREYCPQAVDEELVREILEWAGRSPSGSNTQPRLEVSEYTSLRGF